MDARERLKRAETELRARGVKDVKWTFNPELVPLKLEFDGNGKVRMFYEPVSDEVREKVFEDAACFLEAYLEGRTRPMPRLNDRPARIPA